MRAYCHGCYPQSQEIVPLSTSAAAAQYMRQATALLTPHVQQGEGWSTTALASAEGLFIGGEKLPDGL